MGLEPRFLNSMLRHEAIPWFDDTGTAISIIMRGWLALHTDIGVGAATSASTDAEIRASEIFGTGGTLGQPLNGIARISPVAAFGTASTTGTVGSDIVNDAPAIFGAPTVALSGATQIHNVVLWDHPHRGQGNPILVWEILTPQIGVVGRAIEIEAGNLRVAVS